MDEPSAGSRSGAAGDTATARAGPVQPLARGRRTVTQPRFGELTMDAPTSRRLVLDLAGPAIADNLLVTLVSMFDMIQVGRVGADAIAAVGMSNQPLMVAQAAFMAVNVGATALVARLIGARDSDGANRAAKQSFLVCVVLGLIMGLLLFWATPWVLKFMGAAPDAMARGVVYMRIVCLSVPCLAISLNLSAVMRGSGDTRTPMMSNVVANLINLVFNYLLINGAHGFPRWEAAGAAWATLLSRVVASGLLVAAVTSGRFALRLDLRRQNRFDWPVIRRFMRVGLPAAGEQFVMRGGQMLFARVVASLGTMAYAAHQIAINVESLSFMPGFGFAAATTSLVGQALGAGHPEWADRLARTAQRTAAMVAAGMGVLFFTAGKPIATLYTNLPAVALMSAACLRLVAVAQPFQITNFTLAGALRGAGDTRWTLYATAIGIWGVRLTLAYLLVMRFHMGLVGAWIGMTADMLVRATIVYARFATGKWKRMRV